MRPVASQAATAPKFSQARKTTRERTVRHVPIEERVSVLETHSPTLATRADISDLRSEIIKWGVGAVIALSAVFFALLAANTARTDGTLADIKADGRAMNARIDRLDEKIEASVAKLDAKLENSIAKLDAKIDALAARQDARMGALDAKIDRLDAKLDARFDALLSRQEKLDTKFDAMMAELRSQRSQ